MKTYIVPQYVIDYIENTYTEDSTPNKLLNSIKQKDHPDLYNWLFKGNYLMQQQNQMSFLQGVYFDTVKLITEN